MTTIEEVWKNIVEYESKYKISSIGRIKKISDDKIFKESRGIVRLRFNGELKNLNIRELVVKYFGINIESLPNEIWKPINGYDEKYMISNFGRIYSVYSNVFLTGCSNGKGYQTVLLSDTDNIRTRKYIHRLVASEFIDNPTDLPEVNHKDEDKENNNINNLEWCTKLYNMNYGTRNKRVSDKLINNIYTSKPVIAVEIETGIVLEFKSIKDAKRSGFLCSSISRCCNNKIKKHKGYTWKYKD